MPSFHFHENARGEPPEGVESLLYVFHFLPLAGSICEKDWDLHPGVDGLNDPMKKWGNTHKNVPSESEKNFSSPPERML